MYKCGLTFIYSTLDLLIILNMEFIVSGDKFSSKHE